jgi:hypothetical protein
VDRLVAVASQELVGVLVAERLERSGIRKPDQAVRVHDPDRLSRRIENGREEVLGTDAQASEVRK